MSKGKPETFEDALLILAKPVKKKFVKQKPDQSKADYVPHHIIRQYLHSVFDDHTFRTIDVREYDVERETRKGTTTERHVAVHVELTVRLGDGFRIYYGWGESENMLAPYKSAESDAVKRIAAMHLGLGLHLWSRDHYFLPKVLGNQADMEEAAAEAAEHDADYGGDGDEAVTDDEAAEDDGPDHDEAAETVKEKLGAEEVDDDTPEGERPRTKEQNNKLHALKREMGISSRAWQKRLSKLYDGVTSSKQLTVDQAADLIERLEKAKAEQE